MVIAEHSPSTVAAEQVVRGLMAKRGGAKSFCPSEVARILAGPEGDWRAQMDVVHLAVDAILARGAVWLSWKGQRLERRVGPYRIRGAE